MPAQLQELLQHPVIQGGIAPFIAGLLAAALLHRVRLGGLAAVAGFAAAIALNSGFQFEPLTATRKIVLLVLAAPVIGLLIDFAFKPTRAGAWVLALAGAGAAAWVFLPVLLQKSLAQAAVPGATALALCFGLVLLMQTRLAGDGVRAASAGLALGLGVGAGAILGASSLLGSHAIAIGAASGGLLLLQMILGRPVHTGATHALTVALGAGLLASAATILAQLQWFVALLLGLAPLAVCLPGPERAAPWLRAIVHSLYGCIVSAGACALAYYAALAPG